MLSAEDLVGARGQAGGGTTDVIGDTTIGDSGEIVGVAVHVGGTAGLVDTSVVALVIVELDSIGLSAGGLRATCNQLLTNRFLADLLLGGDGGDDTSLELGEGDLTLTLGLDLGEDHIDVSGGETLVNEADLLAHLGEMTVVHLLGGGATERCEGNEGLLEGHDEGGGGRAGEQ